jgi:hypothetical protein
MGKINLLETRVAFQTLFDLLGMGWSTEAATYYVSYTNAFPNIKTFTRLQREARKFTQTITAAPLRRGREQLITYGIMAKVLFPYEAKDYFGAEGYIPADPLVVWEEGEEKLKKEFSSDMFQSMRTCAEQLSHTYHENFGNYGLGVEEGKLTLYYSGMWVAFLILDLCRKKPRHVSLWVSGSRSFADPLLKHYRDMLRSGSNVRIVVDSRINPEPVKKLEKEYEGRWETKISPVSTTRRMTLVDDVLAIDGVRILPLKIALPAYIGTVYLDGDSIATLQANFDGRWGMAKQL